MGAVRERYGLRAGDRFDDKFSKVSIEGLLFYVVAFGMWAMEKLFDSHKAEADAMLADRTPHTTRWYLAPIFVPSMCLLCALFHHSQNQYLI